MLLSRLFFMLPMVLFGVFSGVVLAESSLDVRQVLQGGSPWTGVYDSERGYKGPVVATFGSDGGVTILVLGVRQPVKSVNVAGRTIKIVTSVPNLAAVDTNTFTLELSPTGGMLTGKMRGYNNVSYRSYEIEVTLRPSG